MEVSAPLRLLERADRALERPRARLVAPALLALFAAALRALYLLQARATPGFGRLLVDAWGYDHQARGVLAGTWPGHEVFYQDPLYPYLVAGAYALFGPDPRAVLVLQTILGVASVLLVGRLARTVLGPSEALLAGVLAACHGPFLFYDTLLLKESLSVLVFTGFLLALVHARRAGRAAAFAAGLALGLTGLLRANLLALLPLAALGLVLPRAGALRRVPRALALLVGTALPILPVTLHNLRAGDFVLTTAQAGQNLYIGNGPHNTTGSYVPPPGVRANPFYEQRDFADLAEKESGRALAPSEVSRFWLAKTRAHAAEDPGAVAALLGKKLLLFLNDVEVPDNYDYRESAAEIPLLRWLGPGFGGLLVLAVAAACLRRWSGAWALLASAALVVGASVVAFFVTDRYRLPVVPLVLVLAASLPGALARALAQGRRVRLGAALLAALAAGGVAYRQAYDVSRTMSCYNRALWALQDGDTELVLAHLASALAEDPGNWRALVLRGKVRAGQGDLDGARSDLEEAVRRAPRAAEARYELGVFEADHGQLEAARASFDAALALDPASDVADLAAVQRADADRRTGRTEEARARLAALVARRPDYVPALSALGLLRAQQGALDEAELLLRHALELRPENTRVRLHLARCLASAGKTAEAQQAYRAVLERDPANAEAARELAALDRP